VSESPERTQGAARLAILSFSAAHPEGRDDDYLRWHLLDHLPEQYSIPQLRLGQRWRAARVAGSTTRPARQPFDQAEHLVAYLFADPIDKVPARWFALGQELYDAGRMPIRLPKAHLGSYEVVAMAGAPGNPVRPEVLPFCPYPAIHVVVGRGGPTGADIDVLAAVDGVAGVWAIEGRELPGRFDPSTDLAVTIAFLEGPPSLPVSEAIEVWLDHRAGAAPSSEVLLSAAFDAVREPPA
jgi:hypothetical protein